MYGKLAIYRPVIACFGILPIDLSDETDLEFEMFLEDRHLGKCLSMEIFFYFLMKFS